MERLPGSFHPCYTRRISPICLIHLAHEAHGTSFADFTSILSWGGVGLKVDVTYGTLMGWLLKVQTSLVFTNLKMCSDLGGDGQYHPAVPDASFSLPIALFWNKDPWKGTRTEKHWPLSTYRKMSAKQKDNSKNVLLANTTPVGQAPMENKLVVISICHHLN